MLWSQALPRAGMNPPQASCFPQDRQQILSPTVVVLLSLGEQALFWVGLGANAVKRTLRQGAEPSSQ
jgi:hypothetical protein